MHRFPLVLLAGLLALSPALPADRIRAAPTTPAPAASAVERFVIVPAESQVIYRVAETFINENNRFNLAVGITQIVRGEIFVDRRNPQHSRVGTITVDISQFRSDNARRDRAIRERWLESARYPLAEFTPTAIRGLPAAYTEDREIALEITGNLKIREAVKPTIFATMLKLERNIVTGTAAATILMTDFGFDPPAIFGILRAENQARLEFKFVARRAP